MKWIGYVRVSTVKQGRSGLGEEAQLKMIHDYIAANGGELVQVYREVESGKRDDRPELLEAMKHADRVKGRLLVGKLDRLSRDLHMITSLQKSKVNFAVCDMPGCDSFTINIYGALAQREAEMISSRTKAALAAAKARGVKLGTNNLKPELQQEASAKGVVSIQKNADDFAAKVLPIIKDMVAAGKGLREIARGLNTLGVVTARGKEWTATAVTNVLARG